MNLYIGLMSGTSMDGIDAALVDVDTHQLISGITRPYSLTIKDELLEITKTQHSTIAFLCQLNRKIGQEFALAVEELVDKTNINREKILAIGSHGQTVAHDAFAEMPYTLQLGCPHTISELTKLTVVADFRTRDIVLEGQGAPFAPLYHRALFANTDPLIAVMNLGGIANITFLSKEKVFGFDIGPANCLMDAWIQKCKGESFDRHGDWAKEGKPIPELLDALLSDAYFKRPFPKSIGKEYFSLDWLKPHFAHYQGEDVQATLLLLTATSICQAINSYAIPDKLLVCGGGVHNQHLINTLKNLLPQIPIESTESYGVSPDFLEAMMFAWLADKALKKEPLNLKSITGSKKPGILGAIYPFG